MFQLQISNSDITNGTIGISWCLDHEIINELAQLKLTDPQVVICVSPIDNYHIRKEYRKVVSLKDLMTFIEFRSSGQNKISGFISLLSKSETREKYLSKSEGNFITNILRYDGDKYGTHLYDRECEPYSNLKYLSHPIMVSVPDGVFAEEPPNWEKIWVNHFFRDKVIDQCQYRKRRIFAYTVQPLIILCDLLFRFLIIVSGILTLCRGVSFKYLIHPLSDSIYTTTDIFNKGSIVIFSAPCDVDDFPPLNYLFYRYWLILLMPLFWVVPAILIFIGCFDATLIFLSVIGLLISLTLVVSFIANHFKVLGLPFSWSFKTINHWLEPKDLWYLEQKEINLITCSDEKKKSLSIQDIPIHRRTIRLKFENIKAKVCKPFSY